MKRIARITTKWKNRGIMPVDVDTVQAYSIDSAMDTDTDSWNIEIGDVGNELVETLARDNEVRVQIFGLGNGGVETLHSGFCDEITVDHNNVYTFTGRDLTAVAVDSQHPPQIWHYVRPNKLVEREARFLKIADRLRLSPDRHFKKYVTDGSESYWEVWYRFYRKNGKWMWAEPDGWLIAGTLNYNARPTYYFGKPPVHARHPYIPVERIEIKSNKQQRVGEVYYFGHRGDLGFVAHEKDPATQRWIKKPTVIYTSSDVHSLSEARAEARDEVFETKVGAVEIKLLIKDPGFIVRQNRMAQINLPTLKLSGEYYVVGTQLVGSVDEGFYQQVRLREKNYAISRRVPTSPQLKDTAELKNAGGIASNLTDVTWADAFVKAAQTYHGVWPLQLFLGGLLSMSQIESPGFLNVRQGGHVQWPGTKDHKVPYTDFNRKRTADDASEFAKFANNFANDPNNVLNPLHPNDAGVGPMQLTTHGYKLAADRMSGGQVGDELAGGRWKPECNIMVAAAVLASKLGAGWSITSDGRIVKTRPSGLSLSPTEENFWAGVKAYNGSGPAADAYMRRAKTIYESTYMTQIEQAIQSSKRSDPANDPQTTKGMTYAELRKRVLENNMIEFTRSSQQSDITFGMIDRKVLEFLLAFSQAGFKSIITALRSDHSKYVSGTSRRSAHNYGKAVDIGNYGLGNSQTPAAMRWIGNYQVELGFSQLIGPVDNLVKPLGFYDSGTLAAHDNHIHVGWPIP